MVGQVLQNWPKYHSTTHYSLFSGKWIAYGEYICLATNAPETGILVADNLEPFLNVKLISDRSTSYFRETHLRKSQIPQWTLEYLDLPNRLGPQANGFQEPNKHKIFW